MMSPFECGYREGRAREQVSLEPLEAEGQEPSGTVWFGLGRSQPRTSGRSDAVAIGKSSVLRFFDPADQRRHFGLAASVPRWANASDIPTSLGRQFG